MSKNLMDGARNVGYQSQLEEGLGSAIVAKAGMI